MNLIVCRMMFLRDGLEFRSVCYRLCSVLFCFVFGPTFSFLLLQAVPRTVWLDPNGKQLLQWPVMELNRLRWKRVMMIHQKLVKGQNVEIKGITAAQVGMFNL